MQPYNDHKLIFVFLLLLKVGELRQTRKRLSQPFVFGPPLCFSSAIFQIGMFEHLFHRHPLDTGSLDSYYGRTMGTRNFGFALLLVNDIILLLDEGHALE